MMEPDHILVIKLGALGDWVLATGPFAAIRAHHPDARITLLTLPAFADWGARCGYFDEIWCDERPGWTQPLAWLALRRRLIDGGFTRVYDLQTSDRSNFYFHLFGTGTRPEWSGVAAGCSHPHANPDRNSLHSVDRQSEQMIMAGIAEVPAPSMDWLEADADQLAPAGEFALLVPGGAPHRPGKRWPAAHYAEYADLIVEQGLTPVLIGAEAETEILREIAARVPASLDLRGRTNLDQIAALARRAHHAVGNDTGPMHIIVACGCPSVVLFSDESDPALSAPRGAAVSVLRSVPLADLTAARVAAAVETLPDRA
jgi:ADP-heptose:LPS heptosyltransferase